MISGGSAVVEKPGSPSTQGDPAAVLRVFAESQVAARREEVRQIALAAAFAACHEVTDWDAAASSVDEAGPGGTERVLALGGDGSPWVSEFCVVDFAAATGRSTAAARAFLSTSMALIHRLPRTWARVKAGGVDGWRARRIAEATLALSAEAAAWVDGEVAARVQTVGLRTLDRLVAEATVRFDPDQLAADEDADLDRRRVEILPTVTGRAATTDVILNLDTPDALDFDQVLDLIADQLLLSEGVWESKAVRRARAVGILARGEADALLAAARVRRTVDLQVRLVEGDPVARLHSLTGQPLGMVSVAQVQEWCTGAHVIVHPVLDLGVEAASSSRYGSAGVRHQVRVTAPTCVFPYCEKPAEGCDLDHITPWDPHGGPDQSNTSNLAPLCRLHHRIKTHTAWRYHQGLPGLYYWTSPTGDRYLVDRDGTHSLSRGDPPP